MKNSAANLLATVITIGFLTVLLLMLSGKVSADSPTTSTLLGALAAAQGAVVNYFFGSSAGSERKTELLASAPAITTQRDGNES